MNIIKILLLIYFITIQSIANAEINSFSDWVISFKKKAENEGITSKTVNQIMDKAIFLPKYLPKLVSIPIKANKSSFSTKKLFSTSLIIKFFS